MSRWADLVRKALADDSVQAGIAQTFVYVMKEHIDEGYGRGPTGGRKPFLPLKPLFGREWKRRPKLGENVLFTRQRGKRKKRTEYLVEVPSYRNGEQPLRRTSHMWRNLNATSEAAQDGFRLTLRGPIYALFQDRGFKTSGPNFIPLTKKGARHATGRNPADEKMKRGKDYFMAKKGVTVPARPFLLPTREDMRMVGRSLYLGLRSVLKGL